MDRKRVRLLAVSVSLLAIALVVAARTRRRAVQPAESVVRATLSNGLRVVIVRDPLAPVAATVMNYLVGSDESPAEFPGLAHAEEHMMFRGSPGLSADQLADIAAAMGGQFDADTQQAVTQYFFTVPAEDLDVALHIESIRMRGALETPALWDQERGAIEQEVAQDLSNPEYVFYTKLLTAMYHGTPYEHDALGTRPSFDRLGAPMLEKFYDTWYAPNDAILVIAGDVDPQKTLAEVKSLFGGIAAKKLPARPAVRLGAVDAQTLHLTTDLPYGLAVISFRLPGYGSPDFAAADVLADVLSSQRGSLYALVPAGKALYAGFSFDPLPESGLGYAVGAFPKSADGSALLQEIKGVLAADVKNGVPADLVEAAKRHELASAEFEKNSISGLANDWSTALAVEGRQSPRQDVDAIAKVTLADVDRAARRYLALDDAVAAVLSPQPSGKPMSGKGFGGAESFAPASPKPVALPAWSHKALARLELPSFKIHPVVTTLPNGLKLIVQQDAVSDTVSVIGRIKSDPDLETSPGREGVSSVLDQLLSYGSQSLDRIAFQKALDDIGADESAGASFSVSVLADSFDRGVQLLADNQLHPGLPAADFPTVQHQVASAVAGQLRSPDYLRERALDAALFPAGDPSLREPTPQTVESLTLNDVKDYYQRVFRPDLTTIVVIGDVSPAQARAVITKYFGAWRPLGPQPATDLPPAPANQPSATTVPDSSRVQDSVTLAETLGLNRFHPDYYALELGNNVLGGGFYATRLYRDLRENAGLVYYVGSSFQMGRTRSIYSVSYACDPENVSKARAIILRDLRQMQTQPVSPAELQQAKAMLLRQIPLSAESLGSIAGGLLSRSITGLPIDEPEIAARRYLALNAEQVRAAFAKWLRTADLVQVVEGPSPR
ncbi:MAG TPA: pitrilysin family protein [Candidatus Acidoferrales bacterium]|nr:pitrilysin family protein [Candidatus Acidoferrales bacterium]